MDYASALSYLEDRERFGIKLGLENIEKLLEALGRPERAFRSVLVAGTNGKGSTTAMLDAIFRAAGRCSGRYTSPHLVRFEERIVVDGAPISEGELARVVTDVAEIAVSLRGKGILLTEPTFFEVATACGFEFFKRRGVEVAAVEVGLGGRFDATNVVPAEVTVLTNVAFDHERYLGGTLGQIASEKAATIKPGRPVVTGVAAGDAEEVIRREAERCGSPIHFAFKETEAEAREEAGGQTVELRTPVREYLVFLPLLGEHQVGNLALAVRAAELLSERGVAIPAAAIPEGIARTSWPARLECIPGAPPLVMDAAHNPHGASALARYLATHPRADRVLLFAVMADKNVDAMMATLFPRAVRVVVTRPPMRRASPPEAVRERARALGFEVEAVEPVARALERAREIAGPRGEVVVAGSIFLAGEVKRLL